MYPNYGTGFGRQDPRVHRVEIDLKDKENKMGQEDRVEVKNIFDGGGHGGDGGMGGLGTAAVVAALGNRNEGTGNIAALAPLLMGGGGFGGFGGGFGAGLVGGILGGALFGGRRGGLFGGGGDDCGGGGAAAAIANEIVLSKLGSIEGAIPLAALSTENAILTQTISNNAGFASTKDSIQIATGALAVAISGTKDAVQNGLFLVSNQLQEGICSVKTAIATDGALTRSMLQSRWTAEDQTKISTQAAEIIELRNEGRHRDRHSALELQITNTNTAVAAQAQGQQQQQFQALVGTVNSLVPCVNALVMNSQLAHARATNGNVIVGNAGATTTGAQTATASPVNVAA